MWKNGEEQWERKQNKEKETTETQEEKHDKNASKNESEEDNEQENLSGSNSDNGETDTLIGEISGSKADWKLTDIIRNLANYRDDMEEGYFIMLDQTKAFDRVNHQYLFKVMDHIGVKGDLFFATS